MHYCEIVQYYTGFNILRASDYKNQIRQLAMWFLNYCSPFIYAAGVTSTHRIIMYSQILALFIVYLIFMIMYKFTGISQQELPHLQKQPKQTLRDLTRIKFCKQNSWISSKLFKQWYLCYFGMHTVAVGICIMYSPYLPQLIFTLIHFVFFVASTILKHLFPARAKSKSALQIVYMVFMTISIVLNIMLLFSGAMGVGASGFDQNAKLCLLQDGITQQANQL